MMAPHWPGSLLTVMSAGQVMVGFSVSLTVTLKLHVAVFPTASVAVQVTGVIPTAKKLPPIGEQLAVTPGQLSFAVGLKLTMAPHWPGSLPTVISAGHVIVGFSSSFTVTLKLH